MKRTYINPYNGQAGIVLEHLFAKGSISQVEAAEVYKIRRLASRIFELREAGWNIESQSKKDMAGQRYVRYYIDKPYRFDGSYRLS